MSGSPSKDSAIKVLDVFHTTVSHLMVLEEMKYTVYFDNAFVERVTSCFCSWSPLQLDCCGKGDDTALFKQVASALCPKKSPEDFLTSQVCTSS